MKIAVISDIHGNSTALNAILADAKAQQPALYLFLGDYVAIGPDPSGVLATLAGLDDAAFVRGNTDRYVMTGEGPPPTVNDAKRDPELIELLIECTASFAWTRGWVCATGWYDWLHDLKLEHRVALPNRSSLLAVHASPGRDEGPGIGPYTSDSELAGLLKDCDSQVICIGHNHIPSERRLGDRVIVNPGSVSNPLAPDLRASYAIINIDSTGIDTEHRRLDYDREAVAQADDKSHHPAAEFINAYLAGKKSVADAVKQFKAAGPANDAVD